MTPYPVLLQPNQPLELQARFAAAGAIPAMTAAGPAGWAAIAVAGAATGLGMLRGFIAQRSQNAQQKRDATACAELAEREMIRNRDIYLQDPARTQADKAYAVENFNLLAAEMMRCCQQVGGSPGQRCQAERLVWSGGEWRNGTTYPYVSWYLQPILDDQPSIVSEITSPITSAIEGIFGGGSTGGGGVNQASIGGGSAWVAVLLVIAFGLTAWKMAD